MKPYYQDGHAVLYCGDCVEVLPLAVRRCDAVVTDPPYVIPSMIASGRGIVRSVGDLSLIERRYTRLRGRQRWEMLGVSWSSAVAEAVGRRIASSTAQRMSTSIWQR